MHQETYWTFGTIIAFINSAATIYLIIKNKINNDKLVETIIDSNGDVSTYKVSWKALKFDKRNQRYLLPRYGEVLINDQWFKKTKNNNWGLELSPIKAMDDTWTTLNVIGEFPL